MGDTFFELAMVENTRLAFGIQKFVVLILKRLGAFLPPSATGVRKNRSAIRGLKYDSFDRKVTVCHHLAKDLGLCFVNNIIVWPQL